ncbi:hypothetical protein [Marivita sp.]|uniref:hypothetical protein n=1 Tax=Marivita sp. TaxID=2003365 RepID=UPI0025C21637|nr:hypothetical protein [Marivita sp.]
MSEPQESSRLRLELDAPGFLKVERLVAYEMGNLLLMLNLQLQQRFGLRAEEYQVYLLIVLATVQRFANISDVNTENLSRAPLPPDLAGSISRRRIADVLGIPFETVRRTVASLLDRGLIEERSRGCLSTRGGTLQYLGEDATPEKLARRFISSINTMIRIGAIKPPDKL